MQPIFCPYCGKKAKFMSSKEFYGKDYGSNLYVCYSCDAYVGTHGKSKTPLGTMANKSLREMRKRAHISFDRLWKSQEMSRSAAYKWMSEVMRLPPQKAHIGMFNEKQCFELLRCLRERSEVFF